MWSVGIVAFVLLCGYLPFDGDSATPIARDVRDRGGAGGPEFASPEWDAVSSGAVHCVRAALTYAARARASAAALLRHAWLQPPAAAATTPTAAAPPRRCAGAAPRVLAPPQAPHGRPRADVALRRLRLAASSHKPSASRSGPRASSPPPKWVAKAVGGANHPFGVETAAYK